MLKFDIIAVGRLKNGPLFQIFEDYRKRIQYSLSVHEVEIKTKSHDMSALECAKIKSHISENAFVVVMDERGNGLRSLDFAKTIENLQHTGETHIQFIIGGADGLTDEIKGRANLLLSFGQQTWPHMLARVMLLEQIYRAQQILNNHPYHRE